MSTVLIDRHPREVTDLDQAEVRAYAAARIADIRGPHLQGLAVLRVATAAAQEIAVFHMNSGSWDSARLAAAAAQQLADRLARAHRIHVENWTRRQFRLPVDVATCRCRPEDACEKCSLEIFDIPGRRAS